jgi:transcriptional regulator with XRE-family HTH domain
MDGAMLRAAREAAGVSLSALATQAHYSKSYLGNVETGEKPVTPMWCWRTRGCWIRCSGVDY